MWLQEYRDKYIEACLDLLWSQWGALGIPGYAKYPLKSVIDVDALVIATATLGRWDPRLFDAMLDWLNANDRFINLQRLRNILKKETFAGEDVIHAIARMRIRFGDRSKWKSLAEIKAPVKDPTPLFFGMGDEQFSETQADVDFASVGLLRSPIKQREMVSSPMANGVSTMGLRLRGLFGVNARAELMLYLLCHEEATLEDAARELYFSQRSLYDIAMEMQATPWIYRSGHTRTRYLWISGGLSKALLQSQDDVRPKWVNWAARWSGLEQLALTLDNLSRAQSNGDFTDELLLASQVRRQTQPILATLFRGGMHDFSADNDSIRGGAILEAFRNRLENVRQTMAA